MRRSVKLVDRDYKVFGELYRWRFLLGRQVRFLADFSSTRTTDRRLKILRENGYIEKQKILYGVSSLYTLSHKGRVLAGVNTKSEKIRLEQIFHNIYVVDSAIYFFKNKIATLEQIVSEKQLHSIAGFSNRKHMPDFIIKSDNETNCVEIELSLKAKSRLQKNIEDNFTEYDKQIWIVPVSEITIRQVLQDSMMLYPNITIIDLEEVNDYVRKLSI